MRTDEEEYGRRLLTPLRDEQEVPLGPSTVDVAAAIVRGRRRVRVRRVIGAGCAAAVVVAVVATMPVGASMLGDRGLPAPAGPAVSPTPTAPAPPTVCVVRRLTPPPGGNAATGVDPTGARVLGRTPGGAGARHVGLIWQNGVVDTVDIPGADQTLTAANVSGTVIVSGVVDGIRRGWVVVNGTVERLKSRTAVVPTAIAEDGTIVGYRFVGPDEFRSVPVIWRGPRAMAEDLPLPVKGSFGRAVDIGPDGTVLGSVTQGRYEGSRGYLWRPDGTVRELPLPDLGGKQSGGFSPVALGERWIGGYAFDEKSKGVDAKLREARREAITPPPAGFLPVPVLFDRTTGRFRSFPDAPTLIEAGNARGWMVGQTLDGRPMLLTEAGPLRLPKSKGLENHTATGVSDDGRVVVGYAWQGGRPRALVWNCG